MTEEQFKALLEASKSKNNFDTKEVMNWLFRALVGLLVWVGLQLNSKVDSGFSTQNNKIDKLESGVQLLTTQNSYRQGEMSNITNKLNANSNILEDTSDKLIRLEIRVNTLEGKK